MFTNNDKNSILFSILLEAHYDFINQCIWSGSTDLWIMRIYMLLGYVDAGTPPVGSSRSWKSMEMEIQSLLEKLLDINDSMSRCAASAGPATSVTQKLARHRDILHEFTQVCIYHISILHM
jgi:hypothetical protein